MSQKFRALLLNAYKHVKHISNVQAKRKVTNILIATGFLGVGSLIYSISKLDDPVKYARTEPQLLNLKDATRENCNFLVNVTQKCTPSVVSIEVKNNERKHPNGDLMTTSSGSGFVVNSDGWILTNAHVVMNKPNTTVFVITANGITYEAAVKDIDLKLDLALLKIPCKHLPQLTLGNSSDVMPGEWVLALGNPLSLRHTITAGVISSVDREAHELGIQTKTMKFIQTDASITFGHSGGPLVNLDGEVIGVNNLRITAGIAFAIPIDYAKEFLLKSSMHAPKPVTDSASPHQTEFGITTLTLSKNIVREILRDQKIFVPEQEQGILVWKVMQDSKASNAGIVAGDVITHINESPVSDVRDVYNKIAAHDKLTFTILRNGQKMYIKFIQRNLKDVKK